MNEPKSPVDVPPTRARSTTRYSVPEGGLVRMSTCGEAWVEGPREEFSATFVTPGAANGCVHSPIGGKG